MFGSESSQASPVQTLGTSLKAMSQTNAPQKPTSGPNVTDTPGTFHPTLDEKMCEGGIDPKSKNMDNEGSHSHMEVEL